MPDGPSPLRRASSEPRGGPLSETVQSAAGAAAASALELIGHDVSGLLGMTLSAVLLLPLLGSNFDVYLLVRIFSAAN